MFPPRDQQGGLRAVPGSHGRHGGRGAGVGPAGEEQHRVAPSVPPHLRPTETQVRKCDRSLCDVWEDRRISCCWRQQYTENIFSCCQTDQSFV